MRRLRGGLLRSIENETRCVKTWLHFFFSCLVCLRHQKHYSKDTRKNFINLYFALYYSLFLFAGILSINTFNNMQPDNKGRFDNINIRYYYNFRDIIELDKTSIFQDLLKLSKYLFIIHKCSLRFVTFIENYLTLKKDWNIFLLV